MCETLQRSAEREILCYTYRRPDSAQLRDQQCDLSLTISYEIININGTTIIGEREG